jgi:hypothetical protein
MCTCVQLVLCVLAVLVYRLPAPSAAELAAWCPAPRPSLLHTGGDFTWHRQASCGPRPPGASGRHRRYAASCCWGSAPGEQNSTTTSPNMPTPPTTKANPITLAQCPLCFCATWQPATVQQPPAFATYQPQAERLIPYVCLAVPVICLCGDAAWHAAPQPQLLLTWTSWPACDLPLPTPQAAEGVPRSPAVAAAAGGGAGGSAGPGGSPLRVAAKETEFVTGWVDPLVSDRTS